MISINRIKQIIEKEEEGPTLDYKEDLALDTDGDKAQFVKDVISLANSGRTTHIIIGVEDVTRKLVGIKTSHKAEQLNDILKGRCDPSLSVEYAERKILGYTVGVIEFSGEDAPYIVSVPDRFGGSLSSDPNKKFYIERGTVFVRKFNKNDGVSRADLDKMYKLPYIALQAEVQLDHEISEKILDDSKEVNITFFIENVGDVIAADPVVWIQFRNVEEILGCKGRWKNQSKLNKDVPTVQLIISQPLIKPVRLNCDSVVVKVNKSVEQIEARVIVGTTNMKTIDGTYIIPLNKGK